MSNRQHFQAKKFSTILKLSLTKKNNWLSRSTKTKKNLIKKSRTEKKTLKMLRQTKTKGNRKSKKKISQSKMTVRIQLRFNCNKMIFKNNSMTSINKLLNSTIKQLEYRTQIIRCSLLLQDNHQ